MGLNGQPSVPPNSAAQETEPLRVASAIECPKRKFSETFRYGQLRLRKRADSGIWYAVYRHPRSGKVKDCSLGTTLKKEAVIQAVQLSTQLTCGKIGVADGAIPLKMLIEKYFAAKKDRVKTKSVKRTMTTQVRFVAWLEATHPDVRLAKHLTTDIVREFQSHRIALGLSPRTCNNDIKNMHSIFNWGIKDYLVGTSPFDYSKKTGTVDLLTLPNTPADTYTEGECQALIAEATRRNIPLVRDLIVVFAGTGMRFEELAHLRHKNIHWDTPTPTIEIRAQNGWSPKDPREVKRIPMSQDVQSVIRRRLQGREDSESWVFTNTVGNRISENWTRKKLQGLFPAVGINGGRRLHWHSFRNYFIIRCLKSGVAVPAIMKWTGHDTAWLLIMKGGTYET